jgi:DNA-binding protein Fis
MEKLNPDPHEENLYIELKKEVDSLIIKGKHREIYKDIVALIEKKLIEIVLERTFGNKLKAAKMLGINRNTLHTKIEKCRIDVDYYRGILG